MPALLRSLLAADVGSEAAAALLRELEELAALQPVTMERHLRHVLTFLEGLAIGAGDVEPTQATELRTQATMAVRLCLRLLKQNIGSIQCIQRLQEVLESVAEFIPGDELPSEPPV